MWSVLCDSYATLKMLRFDLVCCNKQNTKLITFQGKHEVDFLYLLQITASLASYQALYSLRTAFVLSVHLWHFLKQWNAVLDGTDITVYLLAARVFSLLQWVLFKSPVVPHLFVCTVTSTLCQWLKYMKPNLHWSARSVIDIKPTERTGYWRCGVM